MSITQKIILLFIISRILMVASGFRISADYNFMHFHDLSVLQNNFWESIYYTHAFTPWINLFTGFVLLFPESLHISIYQGTFYLFSVIALLMFARLLKRMGIPDDASIVIVILFSLTPPYIYFEHFLSYTFPSMVLLLIAGEYLMKAIDQDSFKSWLVFFAWCVLLCFVRTTFHYIWLIGVLLGVFLIQKKICLKTITAFLLPASLLGLWCLKNLIVFGVFGVSTWSGFNLAFTTVNRLSKAEKQELVAEGVLSPLVLIPIYSNITSYRAYVDLDKKTGIEVLDTSTKSNGGYNFNHHGFILLSSLKMRDNLAYIKQFPDRYIRTVMRGIVQYFSASTRWHPRDKTGSPHLSLRKKIGTWENLYNVIVHSLPIKKVGFYVLFIMLFVFVLVKGIISIFRWKRFSHKGKLGAFLTMNIFYVTTLSCLVTIGELSRYRFMVEPFIWILSISFILGGIKKYKNRKKITGDLSLNEK